MPSRPVRCRCHPADRFGVRDAIARAFDNFRATEYTNPERITRVDNEAEVRSAAVQWAKALRQRTGPAKTINAS
jgi:hypothetical protein